MNFKQSTRTLLVGLSLACLPLPLILNSGVFSFRASFGELLYTNALLIAFPAVFLLLGYRQASKSGELSRTTFLKAAAVVGIAIGLLVIVPLAVPLIYFRPDGVPSHRPASQLIGILSLITGWSILCAAIFWGVVIHPSVSSDKALTK